MSGGCLDLRLRQQRGDLQTGRRVLGVSRCGAVLGEWFKVLLETPWGGRPAASCSVLGTWLPLHQLLGH